MRWGLLLGTAAAIAAAPVIALALLALAGEAAGGPALLAALFVLGGALLLAAIFASDIDRLTETLRRIAFDGEATPEDGARAPRLPPIERITRSLGRLSRTLANRTRQIELLLRADEAIVERLPDPLLVLGEDRSVRRANAAAMTAFGSDMAAVMRHPEFRAALDRAFATGAAETCELSLAVPLQREVQATVLVLDLPLADGGRAIAVFSDRTRERAVERMRADFVANASHELRTPLASLIGFIDTLRGPAADDPPAQRRFLGIMAEQAERMNRLIDDLLNLSRIELTEHQAPSEQISLGNLAERITEAFEPRVAARQMTLELTIADDLPPVIADSDQIAQVIQNLVDNALKYGREGGHVLVSVERAQGGRWPARPGVVLSVSDDGAGIPRSHVPRLTERFYRVDKGRSRSAGGTGLGLAIVKHIVNRHRGQLAIDSEVGKGSTFAIWLPLVAEREKVSAGGDAGS
jgi:two-component system phosphate regulon sensor histidine kinase PhoR